MKPERRDRLQYLSISSLFAFLTSYSRNILRKRIKFVSFARGLFIQFNISYRRISIPPV